jgi:hypothetical protein
VKEGVGGAVGLPTLDGVVIVVDMADDEVGTGTRTTVPTGKVV